MPPSANTHIEHAGQLARAAIDTDDSQLINEIALELFQLQAQHVPVYSRFLETLGIERSKVESIDKIPYLPISLFKSHEVLMTGAKHLLEFQSSGTTGTEHSRHLLADLDLYERSCINSFVSFFGPLEDLCILALLPNYIEQQNSSLIHMVNLFMDRSKHKENGFYLDQFDELVKKLELLESLEQPTLLIGVPYAIMDLLQDRRLPLRTTSIMETGGMKGRRKEMIRSDLHQWIGSRTGLAQIRSEFGMTELLSQAYSKGNGVFQCPPWMRVSIREVNDPFSLARQGKTGGINIIDLANAHSCAFISTMDLGRQLGHAGFEVLGRFDNSDVRGCNLLVQ